MWWWRIFSFSFFFLSDFIGKIHCRFENLNVWILFWKFVWYNCICKEFFLKKNAVALRFDESINEEWSFYCSFSGLISWRSWCSTANVLKILCSMLFGSELALETVLPPSGSAQSRYEAHRGESSVLLSNQEPFTRGRPKGKRIWSKVLVVIQSREKRILVLPLIQELKFM